MSEIKQLASAMLKARQAMRKIHKSQKNAFHGYTYANMEDILEVIEKPLAENNLVITFSIDDVVQQENRTTAQGKTEYSVRVKLTTTIMHTISGEIMSFAGWGEGQDSGDKGIYAAITGGRKYALCSLFNLATTDDPEKSEHEPGAASGGSKSTNWPAAQGQTGKKQSISERFSEAISKAESEQELKDLYADFMANKYLKTEEKTALTEQCAQRKAALKGELL